MNYNIEVTHFFEKQLKRLAKKFPSLKLEFLALIQSLKENPEQGKSLGNNCYKIRISIASKGKGKSGGARVITHLQVVESKIYLLSIYDKSEQSEISDKELDNWLRII
ncbi:type II toxin-antitoxin system RelE/ParE family toxin [Pedobacter fastidiosus]|uniref:Type II toxin-antitoxin system RelE/ParE family toxin n=1 Tax=Pedobacter fastidiosus TaxID=2765361 RepID=A0ABR7KQ01_9SPHI|nr:type II toxin-antitoxin system RelE/ParE family toxin [Pedobacter fastidiosus]MBC6109793.1 type II toxin-antitoxin system RelE/ParE family toxin [Pedobacter fastidiosus]